MAENEIVKFTIPGEPKGKGRPKFSKVGNFVKVYTPETTINYENWVKICFQGEQQKMIDGQLRAEIKCYFAIPKSYSKKKRESAIKGDLRPTKTPDADNVAKSVLDALNKVAYKDDSCVVDLIVEKWYSENPRVEVYIDNGNP